MKHWIVSAAFALGGFNAQADQFHPQLDELFAALASAQQPQTARQIEQIIWRHWNEFPDDSESQYIYNDVVEAVSFGQVKRGLDQVNKVLDTHPEFAEAWNKRATLRYLGGDLPGSVDDIIKTLTLEPRHFGALSGLTQIFIRQGRYTQAIQVIDQLRAISPQTPAFDEWEALARQGLADSALGPITVSPALSASL